MSVNRGMIGLFIWALAMPVLTAACGDDGTGPEGPPTLSAVSPSEGTAGTEVRITGTNFRDGLTVEVGSWASPSATIVNGEVFAIIPDEVEADATYDVTVRNPGGGNATLAAAFTTVAPVLSFVNGATLPSGNGGSTVIIEGDHFGDAQGVGNVFFDNGSGSTIAATVSSPQDWTNQFILATVPAGAGSGPVFVETATGVSASLPFTLSQNAVFSPSTIDWTATTPLPAPVSGHAAAIASFLEADSSVTRRVYSTGGSEADSVPVTTTRLSTIQADGTLGAWSDAGDLASSVSHHGVVAATPFNSRVPGSGRIFVLGGIETKDGQPTATVSSIELNADGSLGASSAAPDLPQPLHSMGAVLFRSTIYVAGGATTDHAPVTTVYRATIDSLGALGAWEELTAFPSARAHHALTLFGATLYVVGGETAATDPEDGTLSGGSRTDEVLTGRLDLRTGELASGWSVSASSLGKTRTKHSALAMGGTLFVTSGLYSAANTGSSENTAAAIQPDGSLASFGGATGSNTLLSVGGVNLFNQAAVTYVDASGVAHVMVLGGDSVNDPGTKSDGVIFY